MQVTSTPEERVFRAEVRDWLHANIPREKRPEGGPGSRAFDLAWQHTQFEGGWAGINWPKEHGGRGLSLLEQLIWYEEYALADAPHVGTCFVGLNHGGPTLIARASEAQKAAHLPRILRGEVIWCQGFSEPGAGSDLAALRTRAVFDGDHLVVNGQKIWTSYADIADFQELLVRTDPAAPKHKGITWVVCDMKTPGITIRPIKTMSGQFHFCEVFYDNVRIPLANVVGEVNDGWSVAMSTLSFERGTAFLAEQIEMARAVDRLVRAAGEIPGPDGERPALQDDEVASDLASLRSDVTALRAMTYASISRIMRRGTPGPEGSMIRLFFGETMQRMRRLTADILGVHALDLNGLAGVSAWEYLNCWRYTIAAGTSDIQRNIIGERLLGLPREGARARATAAATVTAGTGKVAA